MTILTKLGQIVVHSDFFRLCHCAYEMDCVAIDLGKVLPEQPIKRLSITRL